MSVFYGGDVFTQIKKIASNSVNLIYIDPPFGTTKNYWDESLDWKKLFSEFFRVLKSDGMIVIHTSAPKPPLYSWYWNKKSPTCPLFANKQPLRCVEEILVWKNKKTTYYRQQIGTEKRITKTAGLSSYYGDNISERREKEIVGKTRTHIIEMSRRLDGFSTRPDEIVKLMIDSYSKEGDTILDCFCYKGLSYKHSKGRRWIGIDKYFFPVALVNKI